MLQGLIVPQISLLPNIVEFIGIMTMTVTRLPLFLVQMSIMFFLPISPEDSY